MDERIENLPKWAQQEIRRLQQNYDDLKHETESVQRGETPVYYYNMPDYETRHYLPARTRVVFGHIEVSYRDGHIEIISNHGSLIVHPKVTNHIHVETDR